MSPNKKYSLARVTLKNFIFEMNFKHKSIGDSKNDTNPFESTYNKLFSLSLSRVALEIIFP